MIGPTRGAELADLQPRVAVQREDPVDAVRRAVRDHVHARRRAAPPRRAGRSAGRGRAATARWPARDPAPSSMAVCASCPQACMTFGTVEANGSPVASCSGSASMSARSATQRRAAARRRRPGRCRRAGCAARGRRRSAGAPIERGGAALGAAQLGGGVQGATPGHDLGRGAGPARSPATPDRCPRPGRRPRGRRPARRRRPTPTGSSDSTALRLFLVHQPILLTRTAVYQAETTP